MNKEIKFRAWDTKRNKMWSAETLGNDQVGLLPDGRGFANISGENHDKMSCEGVTYTVMFDSQGYWCIDGNGSRNSEMLFENLKGGYVWKVGNIYEEVNNE